MTAISLLEVTVTDGKLHWRLEERDQAASDDKGGDKPLDLSPRRLTNVKMLSDLLRHAEDGKRRDALSQDLYRDLLRVVGHELFDLLFCDETLRRGIAGQLVNLRDGKVALFRITLTFKGTTGAFLSSLPWEYVCTPVGDKDLGPHGLFLAQTAELVMTRRLKIPHPRPLEYSAWPIRVLLVASSPERDPDDKRELSLPPVDSTRIVQKLKELEAGGYIKLHELIETPPAHPVEGREWQVTRRALTDKLREVDPVIVHFVGHGRNFQGAGHLALAKGDGAVDWMADWDFAQLINRSPHFNLAFLQACESGLPDPYVSFSGVASHLAARGLPAVVAMQYQVKSSTANRFAGAFYDALLIERLKIDHAVERGRESILWLADSNERLRFGLPVVYLSTDRGLTDPEANPPNPHRAPALDRQDVGRTCVCVRCNEVIRHSDRVCRWCGLRLRCARCEHRFEDPEDQRYCGECGELLNQVALDEDRVKRPVGAPDTVTNPARATLAALREADAD